MENYTKLKIHRAVLGFCIEYLKDTEPKDDSLQGTIYSSIKLFMVSCLPMHATAISGFIKKESEKHLEGLFAEKNFEEGLNKVTEIMLVHIPEFLEAAKNAKEDWKSDEVFNAGVLLDFIKNGKSQKCTKA